MNILIPMTAEEQLIHDILVLEERKIFLNTLNQEIKLAQREDRDKLTLRQIKAINEYAKEQNRSIAFKAWFNGMQQGVIFDHNDRKELWEKETKRMTFDEWYDQFKQRYETDYKKL